MRKHPIDDGIDAFEKGYPDEGSAAFAEWTGLASKDLGQAYSVWGRWLIDSGRKRQGLWCLLQAVVIEPSLMDARQMLLEHAPLRGKLILWIVRKFRCCSPVSSGVDG